jgi:xylose isomerase
VVKALAAREGRELRSHRDLWVYVDELSERLSNREIRLLWRAANSLHQNFYESWMPPRDVRYAVEDVKRLIEKLKGLVNINQP